jgi:gliding motility-associated-like protein
MEFTENKGQWHTRVNFKGQFSTGEFYLENNGFTVSMHNAADLKILGDAIHGNKTQATDNASSSTYSKQKPLPISDFPKVTVRSHAYKVQFLGCNNNVQGTPDKVQIGVNNYFLGNNSQQWAADCKIYEAVTYKNVYKGIDVRYYSEDEKLKYDFIVHPGANPNLIALRYDGVEALEVKDKELYIKTSVGLIKELYPYTYQSSNGKRESVSCKYVVKDNLVTFKVGSYNFKETLVIDPSLIFASYTGSTPDNWGYTATPGPDGSLFAGGIVFGAGFPTSPGTFQTNYGGGINEDNTGGYDIGIFKFSPNGSQRLYATYIGGSANEQPHSLIADAQGNLIIAGRTNSINYPTRNNNGGVTSSTGYDIVISKLNANGSALIGSIKMGGSADDGVNIRPKYASGATGDISIRRNYGDDARSEVIIDNSGNIVLVSCTQSSNFPVSTGLPIQTGFAGGLQDGVILKFNAALSALQFSSYFGGGGDDACFVIAQNPITSNYFIGGSTTTLSNTRALPGNKAGTIAPTFNGGETDGFVTEILSSGLGVVRTSYIGTSGNDMLYGLKFDNKGFPYIMGTTTGSWPVVNANFSNAGGKQFICKLQPNFSNFVYSTVFGTNVATPNLSPIAFLVDRCENVYVSGWGGGINIGRGYSNSGTLGLTNVNPLPNIQAADGKDFYFFVLEKNATSQLFGSHYGESNASPNSIGDHVDGGTSRFDANGVIYQAVCSCKPSSGQTTFFPTTPGVWSISNRSQSCNEAVMKIELNFAGVGATIQASINGEIDTVGCVPLRVDFIDTLAKGKTYIWDYGDPASPKTDTTFAPNNSTFHIFNNVGTYRVRVIAIDSSTCNITDTAFVTVKVGNNEVTPNFNFLKLDSCTSLRYLFTNTTTAVLPVYTNQSFTWDFGDGSPRVTTGFGPIIHTFPAVGSYNVRLVVTDSNFCNAPDSVTSRVSINPNVKAIFSTPNRGCVPYTPVFKNESLGGLQWLWDFGDGTTSTDFEPVHTYTQVGSYNVRLIAYDSTTCNKVDTSAFFTITVYPIPTANFTWSPNPPIENTIIQFTNTSIGATRYLWDFGDGATSTEVNPGHLFNKTDTFNVSLVAFNDADCADTIIQPVRTLIFPLIAVPNAFTPGRFASGSYNNGIIKVEGFGIAKMTWRIYNRWGQVMFTSNNQRQGWDGTFKGVLQPMDVYTYTLDVEFGDGQRVRKTGDITLLR